uniref:Uncharacterized protein n=1 Tax=Cacopsylla melanoneura TaxID=428564 RepID=A0A8D8PSL2_9HEMI
MNRKYLLIWLLLLLFIRFVSVLCSQYCFCASSSSSSCSCSCSCSYSCSFSSSSSSSPSCVVFFFYIFSFSSSSFPHSSFSCSSYCFLVLHLDIFFYILKLYIINTIPLLFTCFTISLTSSFLPSVPSVPSQSVIVFLILLQCSSFFYFPFNFTLLSLQSYRTPCNFHF